MKRSASGARRGVSNLEVALMLANLQPEGSETRGCTQCSRPVPKTQVLLTCEKCREAQKRKKARRKERIAAAENGDPIPYVEGSISSKTAAFQAVIDAHERKEAAKKPAASKLKTGAKGRAEKVERSEIEDLMDEDLDSVRSRLKSEFMAAKGQRSGLGTKRKRELDDMESQAVADAKEAIKRAKANGHGSVDSIVSPKTGRDPRSEIGALPLNTEATASPGDGTETPKETEIHTTASAQNKAHPIDAGTVTKEGRKTLVKATLAGWFKASPKPT